VVAVAAAELGFEFGRFHRGASYALAVQWIAAVSLMVFGTMATRRLSASLSRLTTRRWNPGAGGTVRLASTGLGLLILLFTALAVLGTSLQHLLIGAGLAGVVLGIAAQQSLGNVFAALVLLFARPFVVGDHIQIRSGALGTLDVWVLGSGLTYVTVLTSDGPLKVPNSIMLASAIARLRAPPEPTPAPAPAPDAATPTETQA
jgi:small-conductance mechanosensitive channel